MVGHSAGPSDSTPLSLNSTMGDTASPTSPASPGMHPATRGGSFASSKHDGSGREGGQTTGADDQRVGSSGGQGYSKDDDAVPIVLVRAPTTTMLDSIPVVADDHEGHPHHHADEEVIWKNPPFAETTDDREWRRRDVRCLATERAASVLFGHRPYVVALVPPSRKCMPTRDSSKEGVPSDAGMSGPPRNVVKGHPVDSGGGRTRSGIEVPKGPPIELIVGFTVPVAFVQFNILGLDHGVDSPMTMTTKVRSLQSTGPIAVYQLEWVCLSPPPPEQRYVAARSRGSPSWSVLPTQSRPPNTADSVPPALAPGVSSQSTPEPRALTQPSLDDGAIEAPSAVADVPNHHAEQAEVARAMASLLSPTTSASSLNPRIAQQSASEVVRDDDDDDDDDRNRLARDDVIDVVSDGHNDGSEQKGNRTTTMGTERRPRAERLGLDAAFMLDLTTRMAAGGRLISSLAATENGEAVALAVRELRTTYSGKPVVTTSPTTTFPVSSPPPRPRVPSVATATAVLDWMKTAVAALIDRHVVFGVTPPPAHAAQATGSGPRLTAACRPFAMLPPRWCLLDMDMGNESPWSSGSVPSGTSRRRLEGPASPPIGSLAAWKGGGGGRGLSWADLPSTAAVGGEATSAPGGVRVSPMSDQDAAHNAGDLPAFDTASTVSNSLYQRRGRPARGSHTGGLDGSYDGHSRGATTSENVNTGTTHHQRASSSAYFDQAEATLRSLLVKMGGQAGLTQMLVGSRGGSFSAVFNSTKRNTTARGSGGGGGSQTTTPPPPPSATTVSDTPSPNGKEGGGAAQLLAPASVSPQTLSPAGSARQLQRRDTHLHGELIYRELMKTLFQKQMSFAVTTTAGGGGGTSTSQRASKAYNPAATSAHSPSLGTLAGSVTVPDDNRNLWDDSDSEDGDGGIGADDDDSPLLLPPSQFDDEWGATWTRSDMPLGGGTSATVWLGMNAATGALAAVKVIPKQNFTTPAALVKLRDEMRVLTKLRHERIVEYKSCAVAEHHVMVVTEYVSGGSLEAIVEGFGALPPAVVAKYIRDVLEGLRFLHVKGGVIHRDIKPGNILVSLDGRCKLSDFGTVVMGAAGDHRHHRAASGGQPAAAAALGSAPAVGGDSRHLGSSITDCVSGSFPPPEGGGGLSSTTTGSSSPRGGASISEPPAAVAGGPPMSISVDGSPLYMAPEQARGQPTAKSDIWAVGLVALYMFSGGDTNQFYSFPLDHGNPFALLLRLGRDEHCVPVIPPVDPSVCGGGVSEAARAFLSRCFERDPEQRASADWLLRNDPFVKSATTL